VSASESARTLELARGLFDPGWYPVDDDSLVGPFEHFIALGCRTDGDPHPLFSVEHYLAQVPELAETGDSPLLHFVREGWIRGLSPHPLFDTEYYVRRYGSELQAGEDPLTHFLREGSEHVLMPSPWFDTAFYRHHYSDVYASGMNMLVHFVVFGGKEGRRPSSEFEPTLHARRRRLPATVNPLIDFLQRLERVRASGSTSTDPEYSVVILNYNKPLMTVQAVTEVLEDPEFARRAEVIVVDNGSDPQNYTTLRTQLPTAARLLRLDVNRFFGEGNNLGAELARGEFIIFLNNDAFLDAPAVATMRKVFTDHPDCGAVGPRFLYPDGRVQEAGALISPCGIAVQRGKFLSPAVDIYTKTEPVDYVSAACVMLRRETFDEVGGFDLIWDPAYYEDADLGLKVGLLGKRVYYCPDASVVHVENTTSGDERLALRMDGIVEVNREKFVARWSHYLESGRRADRASVTFPSRTRGPRRDRVAVVYTPYPLYPGGGERYLLTIAEALAPEYDVVLATPELYSTWRLRTVARDLRLDLSHVTPIARRDLERYADCELFVAMGNELYPTVQPQGRRALYHCQFPFQMTPDHVADHARNLVGYEAVVVNSEFTAGNYRAEAERYGEHAPPILVIAPPVQQVAEGPEQRVPFRILHVGRFTPHGHGKRQDVLVEAFRALVRDHPTAELHLAGAVPATPAARDYVLGLRRATMDLPVTFHLNVAPAQLDALYRSSAVYWHATGYDSPVQLGAESQEHFGISIVEAMSAGAYPIVFDGGGPPGFIEPTVSGELWSTTDDLVELTRAFFEAAPESRRARSAAAREVAKKFDQASFTKAIRTLLSAEASSANGAVPREALAADARGHAMSRAAGGE
jgi:O-antigen biosynthesis protein